MTEDEETRPLSKSPSPKVNIIGCALRPTRQALGGLQLESLAKSSPIKHISVSSFDRHSTSEQKASPGHFLRNHSLTHVLFLVQADLMKRSKAS